MDFKAHSELDEVEPVVSEATVHAIDYSHLHRFIGFRCIPEKNMGLPSYRLIYDL